MNPLSSQIFIMISSLSPLKSLFFLCFAEAKGIKVHPEQMHLSHEFVGWLEGGFVC